MIQQQVAILANSEGEKPRLNGMDASPTWKSMLGMDARLVKFRHYFILFHFSLIVSLFYPVYRIASLGIKTAGIEREVNTGVRRRIF